MYHLIAMSLLPLCYILLIIIIRVRFYFVGSSFVNELSCEPDFSRLILIS